MKEKKEKDKVKEKEVNPKVEADEVIDAPQANPEEEVITKLTSQRDDYLDKWQRLAAEFENFRKRTAKEKTSMYDDGFRDAVLEILPVIDNFERALSTVGEQERENNFIKGIVMILKQFTGILSGMGITEIEALNQPFDPNFHNAVAKEENKAFGENTVCEVLQKGYLYKDKVIRHSIVKVAN